MHIVTIAIGYSSGIPISSQTNDNKGYPKEVLELHNLMKDNILTVKQDDLYLLVSGDNNHHFDDTVFDSVQKWLSDSSSYIGFDKRSIHSGDDISKSILSAKFHAYRNRLSKISPKEQRFESTKEYITLFKELLNEMLSLSTGEKLDREIIEVSAFLDELIVSYSEMENITQNFSAGSTAS